MKYFLTFILLVSLSSVTKAQESRWKTLFFSDDGKKKTCVDTISPVKVRYLDEHFDVVLIWLREYSMPTKEGEYKQQEDSRVAVDVRNQQFEFKSKVTKYNKVVTDNKDYDIFNWSNIVPESVEETVLNYCKSYLKNNK